MDPNNDESGFEAGINNWIVCILCPSSWFHPSTGLPRNLTLKLHSICRVSCNDRTTQAV